MIVCGACSHKDFSRDLTSLPSVFRVRDDRANSRPASYSPPKGVHTPLTSARPHTDVFWAYDGAMARGSHGAGNRGTAPVGGLWQSSRESPPRQRV